MSLHKSFKITAGSGSGGRRSVLKKSERVKSIIQKNGVDFLKENPEVIWHLPKSK